MLHTTCVLRNNRQRTHAFHRHRLIATAIKNPSCAVSYTASTTEATWNDEALLWQPQHPWRSMRSTRRQPPTKSMHLYMYRDELTLIKEVMACRLSANGQSAAPKQCSKNDCMCLPVFTCLIANIINTCVLSQCLHLKHFNRYNRWPNFIFLLY